MQRREFIAGLGGAAASPLPARSNFVTNCRVVAFASFMVLGTWTLPANGEPNEAPVPRPCTAFPKFCELIRQEAGRTGLDPRLVDAVIKVESNYRPDAIGVDLLIERLSGRLHHVQLDFGVRIFRIYEYREARGAGDHLA